MTQATATRDEVATLRVPPHSVEAEQSVLGGLLLDNTAWDRAGDLLREEDFYRHEHRVIFGVIGSMVNANRPADVLTVFERLESLGKAQEVGGLVYLNSLAQSVASASNMRRYAEIVRERAILRKLVSVGDELATAAFNPQGRSVAQIIEETAAVFDALQRQSVKKAPVKLEALLVQALDRYNDLAMGTKTPAWSTGIPTLDRVLSGGLRAGKVYGIAARPSVGKSSLARYIGLALAEHGCKTLLLSQEMPGEEVADCAVAQLGAIDSQRLQTGELDDGDWNAMADAVERGVKLPFYVDDEGALTIGAIQAKARLVKGLGCLILDYLQLSSSTLKNANRNDQVEEVSRGLKALAMSLNIPVVVLSQLNRDVEKRADKEPQLSDLRDSGAIEQDLDVAIMLWTHREFDDGARRIVGCKVPKHRGGPKGKFALEFKASTYRWYESEASLEGPTRTEMRGKGFE